MEYDDQVYDGQWVAGDCSGFGIITYKNTNDSYQGGFFDNMKHGLGVMKYSDGRIYDGTFQFDRMGKGKMTYTDGSTCWGYWSNDSLPHGRGKLTFADDSVYDGEFDRGCMQGHGRMTLPGGQWYLGEWTYGKKNGIGLEVLADGSICHEGTFCNGRPLRCSSFPQRRRSSSSHLLFRLSSTRGSIKTLVGPLPRHLSMQNVLNCPRLQ
jgi:hypothetical protein